MSKPVMNVALVCGPDCGLETQAVRSALECLGARVITYWIGRPNDFIDILSGEDLYPGTDMIVLDFHGDEGEFLMPELGEDVYEENEPKGNFGPNEIRRFAKLDGKIVIGNGCSLGAPELAEAFLHGGCRVYIGPDDYPDGDDALMFVLRFFYETIRHGKSVKEAYELARAMGDGLTMYRLYEHA